MRPQLSGGGPDRDAGGTPSATSAKRGRPVSAQKRAAILEAATIRFLRDGLADTSMDAVAADAGVSKQTVFGHFGSKEGLFKSVIDGARAQAPAPPTVADSDRLLDPEDLAGSLAKVGRTLMRVVFDPRIAALRRLLIAEAPRRPDLRKAWTDGAPKAFNEGLTRELGELSRAGRLDISDPALATRQLIGLWVYPRNVISAYGSESVSEDEENAIIREAVMFFLKAYERPKRDY